jgi:hypothetical protein
MRGVSRPIEGRSQEEELYVVGQFLPTPTFKRSGQASSYVHKRHSGAKQEIESGCSGPITDSVIADRE